MKKAVSFLFAVLVLMLFVSCGQEASPKEVSLKEVMTDISLNFDLPEDMICADNALDLKNYYGIDAKDAVQYQTQAQGSGSGLEEIVLIEVKDEKALQKITEQLNNKLKSKLSSTKKYQPGQYDMIKDCKVQTNGHYVCMIISENAREMIKIYNSYFTA